MNPFVFAGDTLVVIGSAVIAYCLLFMWIGGAGTVRRVQKPGESDNER